MTLIVSPGECDDDGDIDALDDGEPAVEGVGGVVDVESDVDVDVADTEINLTGVTVVDEYVVELPLPVKNAVGSVALGDGEFDPLLLLKPVPEVVEQPLVEGETLAVAEHEGSATEPITLHPPNAPLHVHTMGAVAPRGQKEPIGQIEPTVDAPIVEMNVPAAVRLHALAVVTLFHEPAAQRMHVEPDK